MSGRNCIKCANRKKKTTEEFKKEIYDLVKNESIKNVVRGFYIEGFSVDCVSGKNKLTYLNDRLSTNLVCANGNKTPYIETIADGTSSFADGSTCTTDGTNYAYATRVIKYDCLLKDDKSEYVKPSEPATTSSNKDDDTTLNPENKGWRIERGRF